MDDQTHPGPGSPEPAAAGPPPPVPSRTPPPASTAPAGVAPPGPAPAALYVPPKSAERNFKWRWGFAAVATAAAAAFCAWALVNNTYTIGNRAVAAVGALFATAALCAIGNAALLSYQVKAGTIPATNVDFRLRGLKAACMGADGRASTSKTGIVAWTGAVITALIYLLLLSRTVVGAGLFLGAVDQNWRPEYLVLLGLPAAAATVAAATVKHSNKDKGPLPADGTAPRVATSGRS